MINLFVSIKPSPANVRYNHRNCRWLPTHMVLCQCGTRMDHPCWSPKLHDRYWFRRHPGCAVR
ncbi:hypothetical protein KCP69_05635 [Salmonella enterica subsp. enterica]|nr:hypothetical protein KCP69_05635 [Salmonella enterica subsp. enterica]